MSLADLLLIQRDMTEEQIPALHAPQDLADPDPVLGRYL